MPTAPLSCTGWFRQCVTVCEEVTSLVTCCMQHSHNKVLKKSPCQNAKCKPPTTCKVPPASRQPDSRKAAMSVCLSVHPHVTTRLPPSYVSGMMTKFRRDNSSLLKVGQQLPTSRESLRGFVMGHYNWHRLFSVRCGLRLKKQLSIKQHSF